MNTKRKQQADTEDVEGLGYTEDNNWGDYPIDTLLIRNETRTVHDVLRRIQMGSFIMDPDFQRAFIWPTEKQSKLIESVLLRIPLPVFYLAEDEQGKMIVVDGLQRLTTFQRFVNNKFHLNLPEHYEIHKKCFNDLSPKLQNRIEDCNLILYVIDAKVPERARLDIFERVNGGVPLTRQQMRNCLFMGQATRFLRAESKSEIFKNATGNSLNVDTMRDREFVNRFCSFKLLGIEGYKGDMDDFLARGLKKMNKLSDSELEVLSRKLRTSLSNNLILFGRHAFRKHTQDQPNRSIINASLWDVMSTIFAELSENEVEAKKDNFRNAFYSLLKDDEFNDAITYGPNDMRKVKCRFVKALSYLRGNND